MLNRLQVQSGSRRENTHLPIAIPDGHGWTRIPPNASGARAHMRAGGGEHAPPCSPQGHCACMRVRAVMIIARSGEAPVPFKPRQPKRLPQDWSGGSPDSNLIAAAGRYRQGLRPVNAFTARDVTVLDLCKHSLLVVSLDSLAELHSLHLRPWNTGHAWAPLGPPEFGSMSGRVAEVGEDGSAVEMGQS